MDTSLAEEKTQTMPTLAPDSFFFMSPYRSFTTQDASPAMRNRQLMAIRQTALSNKK